MSLFVSYLNSDFSSVSPVISKIKNEIIEDIWFDKIELQENENLEKTINSAIKECTIFLCFLSDTIIENRSNSIFLDEIRTAQIYNKNIIYIRLSKINDTPKLLEENIVIDLSDKYSYSDNFTLLIRMLENKGPHGQRSHGY